MQRLFKAPRVKKPKIQPIKITATTPIKHKNTVSLKTVAKWWDYLLHCEDDTKTDRNTIYWKYKESIDQHIDKNDLNSFFTLPFDSLQTKTREFLVKVYKNEFKK
jgi:hypothetical protein